ncbi:MAG: M20/M25/M40 family metallo-hydrolase [Alphaproteobacteria bacterium]|nr:M20/M25/M40 family metallo-hydrolase [Alphaproteobacteria bacterium]
MDPHSWDEIGSEVAKRIPNTVRFLSNLIECDSTLGKEGPVQRLIKSEMERLGLEVTIIKSRPDQDAVNLAARIPGASGRDHKSLALCAHADIVPVDAENLWLRHPFKPLIEEGCIYGRGAQDDKAGIAAMLLAAETLLALGHPLPGDLLMYSVIEEETSGAGTQAVLDAGFEPDGAIIIDGAWPARIFYAHPGHASAIVTIRGDALAASNERRAVNPIDLAFTYISSLREDIKRWNEQTPLFCQIENPFFLNIGKIQAGTWCGSVPAQAEVHLQAGFAPPQTIEGTMAWFRSVAERMSDRIEVAPGPVFRPPHAGDPKSPLIRELAALVDQRAAEPTQIVPITGYTDMPFFKTPNVCLYGPGGGRNAHGIDECYLLDHMLPVVQNLVAFAFHWCQQRKPS